MASLSVPGNDVTASASAKTGKEVKAYKKMLSKTTYTWSENTWSVSEGSENETKNYSFTCVDINYDGVKELIVTNSAASYSSGYLKIFTYTKGKVKCVLDSHGVTIYKKTGIIMEDSAHTGSYSTTYYKLKNNKVKEKAYCSGTDMADSVTSKVKHVATKNGYKVYYTSYCLNNKEVSYKKYQKQIKKYKKSGKRKLTYHKNTAANRKKYLR